MRFEIYNSIKKKNEIITRIYDSLVSYLVYETTYSCTYRYIAIALFLALVRDPIVKQK